MMTPGSAPPRRSQHARRTRQPSCRKPERHRRQGSGRPKLRTFQLGPRQPRCGGKLAPLRVARTIAPAPTGRGQRARGIESSSSRLGAVQLGGSMPIINDAWPIAASIRLDGLRAGPASGPEGPCWAMSAEVDADWEQPTLIR
jgi:hypothetical protein